MTVLQGHVEKQEIGVEVAVTVAVEGNESFVMNVELDEARRFTPGTSVHIRVEPVTP